MVKLKSKDGEKFEVGDNCLNRSKVFIEFKDILNLEQEITIKGKRHIKQAKVFFIVLKKSLY